MTTQTMKPSEILIAARELISVPDQWTQRIYARDKDGKSNWIHSSESVCFCSSGAIRRVSRFDYASSMTFLVEEMGGEVTDYNDTHTHAEVIAAFDRAIVAAKDAGQ